MLRDGIEGRVCTCALGCRLALLHGKGVERDADRAMGLIRDAAAAGNEYALEFLAR